MLSSKAFAIGAMKNEYHLWSPTGKARGTSMKYPPTPLGAGAFRWASVKASEGFPPVAKSAEAFITRRMNDITKAYAFIHGQSPWFSAQADNTLYQSERDRSARKGAKSQQAPYRFQDSIATNCRKGYP